MRQTSCVAALLIGCAAAALAGPLGSPVQWTGPGANNHWYQVVLQGAAWQDAVTGASAMGGYLATATSGAENDFIFGLLGTPGLWVKDETTGHTHGVRLGASDPTMANAWQWQGSESWGYTNWYPGEPNYIGVEDSLAFFDPTPTGMAATWNNVSKLNVLPGYVVEWDSAPPTETPEPASLVLMASAGAFLVWRRRRHA